VTLVELSAFLAGDERVEGEIEIELQKGAWGMTVSIRGRTVGINNLFLFCARNIELTSRYRILPFLKISGSLL
jgi:hypothetical protein